MDGGQAIEIAATLSEDHRKSLQDYKLPRDDVQEERRNLRWSPSLTWKKLPNEVRCPGRNIKTERFDYWFA